jgi:hypothetical protein
MTRRSVVTLIAFLSFSLPSFCQQIQALDLGVKQSPAVTRAFSKTSCAIVRRIAAP